MLTTREINNTGMPLLDAKGVAIVGAKIEFQLVKDRVPTDSFDTISGERVISRKHEATTDANGEFSIDLWPTSRGENGVVYLCSVMGRPVFFSPLLDGETALSWFDFYSAGIDVAPAELTVFQAHLANVVIHHSHANKVVLDKFSEDESGNPLYAGGAMGGGGTETLVSMGALVNSAGAITTPAVNDDFLVRDSASGLLAKISPANLLAWAKAYFDTLYATIASQALKAPIQSPTLLGQYDTVIAPAQLAAQSNAYDVTFTNAGRHRINAALMTNAHVLTLNPVGWPNAAAEAGTMVVYIVTGASVPSVVMTGGSATTLVPSKTNRIIIDKDGTGSWRHDGVVSY